MRLDEKIDSLARWLRYQATYLKMKHYLKECLNGTAPYRSMTMTICPHHRDIGKTAALARLSEKYNIPIIAPTIQRRLDIELSIPSFLPKYFKKNKPKAIVASENNCRGIKYKVVLIEEGLTKEQLEMVYKMSEYVVGYKNI